MRGAYNYANHRSTKILLIAYKLDDEPTRIVDLTGSNSSTSGHSEFFRRLTETDEPYVHGMLSSNTTLLNTLAISTA